MYERKHASKNSNIEFPPARDTRQFRCAIIFVPGLTL